MAIVEKCTDEQFTKLHEALDGTRASSEFVKVDRQALVNLLNDHRALQALNK